MHGADWGGSEELWAAAARLALRTGHSIYASVPVSRAAAPQLAALASEGALLDTWHVDWGSWRWRLRRKLKAPFSRLLRFRPDVVCITQGGTYDGAGMFYASDLREICRRHSLPYILISQANADIEPSAYSRRIQAEVFDGAAHVLFVARNNLQMAERHLARRIRNADILENPVNLSDTSPVPWPSPPRMTLASVARLHVMHKGQDVLFEALSALTRRDWHLSLYGSGPDLQYLVELAEHYDLERHVSFRGYVSDIRGIWAENELLVLPSRQEGTPLVLMEAMLCGRPALVTDVGDSAEWIREGVTGFVAEAPTARSLTRALQRAMESRSAWSRMGAASRELAAAAIDPQPAHTLLKILATATLHRRAAVPGPAPSRSVAFHG
jgi:glycosyltransferase involved in cell wall biosynthesis